MKTLNLDELKPETRVLKIAGESYEMKQMTVADFIDITRDAAKAAEMAKEGEGKNEEERELSISEQATFMVDSICGAFPTCPREVLLALSVDQLMAIIQFARGELDDQAKASEGN